MATFFFGHNGAVKFHFMVDAANGSFVIMGR
jgi:hypothetical protein